jgi:hypothetical protein
MSDKKKVSFGNLPSEESRDPLRNVEDGSKKIG